MFTFIDLFFAPSNKSIWESSKVKHRFSFLLWLIYTTQYWVLVPLKSLRRYYEQIWRFIADLSPEKEKCDSLNIQNLMPFTSINWFWFSISFSFSRVFSFCCRRSWWWRWSTVSFYESVYRLSYWVLFIANQFLLCI